MSTIFHKIITKEAPADIVFENDRILAFKDIAPAAPIHFLLIPKKEIPSLQEVAQEDYPLLQEIMEVAQQLAVEYGVADGYRLLTNVGSAAGQTVHHLHFHLIGGKTLGSIA